MPHTKSFMFAAWSPLLPTTSLSLKATSSGGMVLEWAFAIPFSNCELPAKATLVRNNSHDHLSRVFHTVADFAGGSERWLRSKIPWLFPVDEVRIYIFVTYSIVGLGCFLRGLSSFFPLYTHVSDWPFKHSCASVKRYFILNMGEPGWRWIFAGNGIITWSWLLLVGAFGWLFPFE